MSTAVEAGRVSGRGNGLSIRVSERIEEIDPAEWDSLPSPCPLLSSHRFVSICERSGVENAIYRHVTIERQGRVVAAASLSCIRVSLDLLASDWIRNVFRWTRSMSPSFLNMPVVMCGLPVSFGSSCVRVRANEDAGEIAEALASCAESMAEDLGAALVCFKELTDGEAASFDRLNARGYFRASSLPYCTMSLRWRTFESYLTNLRSGYRRQVRSNLAAAKSAGLTVRKCDDFTRERPGLFRLYEQVMDRAEHRLECLNPSFFDHLDTDLGPASRALLVERDDRLIAAGILLDEPAATTFLIAGIDDAPSRACQAYPYLVTQIVADAIERGARQIHLGQTSYAMKGRLGAQAEPRWIYLKHRGDLPNRLLRSAAGALFPSVVPLDRRVFRDA